MGHGQSGRDSGCDLGRIRAATTRPSAPGNSIGTPFVRYSCPPLQLVIIDEIETLWPAAIGARPEDAAVETMSILPITLPLFRVADRRERTAAAL
jgi:hypothetical protein